jgi:hypothetical protein
MEYYLSRLEELHTCTKPSAEPVMKNFASLETATDVTGALCSYKVVMSLPVGLHSLRISREKDVIGFPD